MLKAILFDLGDTLFDFEPMDTRAVFELSGRSTYEFLLARGQRLPSYERYFRRHYWGVRRSYLWSLIRRREFNSYHLLCRTCSRMRLNLEQEALQELAWHWYTPVAARSTVADDVIPTLTRFRDRGLKLAIVSNTFIPGFVLDKHLEQHGLLEFFPVRIYSSEIGYRKPHPRIFRAALEAVGVKPAQAVFVGDRINTDILGAQRAGMTAILRQPKAASRTHRTADHVIRKISELYQILPLLGAAPAPQLPAIEELAYEA